MTKERKDLLAYCGFYCGDCLGYTGVIADAARDFMKVLEKYEFDRTAKCVFPEELEDYDTFYEALGFMTGLYAPGSAGIGRIAAYLAMSGGAAKMEGSTPVTSAMTSRHVIS